MILNRHGCGSVQKRVCEFVKGFLIKRGGCGRGEREFIKKKSY